MRPEYVGLVDHGRIFRPQTIVGTHMEDAPHAACGHTYCGGIAEIASCDVDIEARQLVEWAVRSHQHADGVAVRHQLPHEVRSGEPGRAGDECRHGVATAAAAAVVAFLRLVSCQVSSFQLSPNCRLAPRTAEGS